MNLVKFVVAVDELSVLGTDEPTSVLNAKGDCVPEVQEAVETSETLNIQNSAKYSADENTIRNSVFGVTMKLL